MTDYSDEVYAFFAFSDDNDVVVKSTELETLGEFLKRNNINKKVLKIYKNFLYAITAKGLQEKIDGC